jgi:hypothetical protein
LLRLPEIRDPFTDHGRERGIRDPGTSKLEEIVVEGTVFAPLGSLGWLLFTAAVVALPRAAREVLAFVGDVLG